MSSYYEYIPPSAEVNLTKYKFSSTDHSVVYKYVLGPLAEASMK